MKKLLIYVHGKGGSASEAQHYASLFPGCDVVGFDYKSDTPWDAISEFQNYFDTLSDGYESVRLIANSVGAFFSLCSLGERIIEKAYFISPIVDMKKLIYDMMKWSDVTESYLCEKREIKTEFGETLSYEYLEWVKKHTISWNIPTRILFGSLDNLQSFETVKAFAKKCGAEITVMENGEHWFHTSDQMNFLDEWIREGVSET